MNQGMLWYDNHKGQPVENRLQKAIDYFVAKYGYTPVCCFVNPEMLSEPIKLQDSIKVIPNERVLRNHIWLEMDQEK